MNKSGFKLSSSGKIAALITLSCVAFNSAANSIVAHGSPNGPNISQAGNGASIVDIVKPNQNGLSHNKYNDFNVNQPGAVLNNSLTGGNSQLAGILDANSNLNGQAANIILNEVVSRNPSLLLGKQEVFGMAADYVLANPNGISCSGCGFINTNSAALVVGNPLVENGILKSYSTQNNNNGLSIDANGISANSVLDLVAPKIDSNGEIKASVINAITGNNLVSADLNTISASTNKVPLDSYYLGGMRAGSIRIVNTAQGSGVKLSGDINADKNIDIKSADDLRLTVANVKGGDIALAANNITAEGQISQNININKHSQSGREVINNEVTETYTRTKIAGKNLTLISQQKTHITASDVQGENVVLQGGSITLDGQKLTQSTEHQDNNWKGSWKHNETQTDEKITQESTMISATQDTKIIANQGDVNILGANISAEQNLSVEAKDDIHLNSLIESNKQTESGQVARETSSLKTGGWKDINTTQTLKQSELKAGKNLGLNADKKIIANSAIAKAGNDLIVRGKEGIDIGTQTVANHNAHTNNYTYWGGIGGGTNENSSHTEEQNIGSQFTSNAKLLISSDNDVTIIGSKIKGTQDSLVQTGNGKLIIQNATNRTADSVNNRHGTVFNITDSSIKEQSEDQKVVKSELKSDANLKLISGNDIDVIGSMVESAGELNINALGNVNVKSAIEEKNSQKEQKQLTVKPNAQKDDDKQYSVSIDVNVSKDKEHQEEQKNISSDLKGGSINIDSQNDINVTGSKLETTQGDANLSATNITINAAQDVTVSEKHHSDSKGGFYFTGGKDKFGSGISGGYSSTDNSHESSKASASSTNVKGNLVLNGQDKITQEGAKHNVSGSYSENAQDIEHKSAYQHEKNRNSSLTVESNIGVTVDYSGVTHPVEGASNNVAKGNVSAALDSVGSISAPDIGIDIAAKGSSSQKDSESSKASVTEINAGQVNINGSQTVTDESTEYIATQGEIQIDANDYQATATINTQRESDTQIEGSSDLRIATSTGSDISIKGNGKGSNKHSDEISSHAVTGKLDAANGVTINAKNNTYLQSTDIKGGSGQIAITAKNDLKFEQANDTHSKTINNSDANAKLKFDSTNATNISGGFGGGVEKQSENQSKAVTGSISGQDVILSSGHDLTITGGDIKSEGDIKLNADNQLSLTSAKSTEDKNGSNIHGNVNLGSSNSDGEKSTSGKLSFGGDFALGKQSEQEVTYRGPTLESAKNVELTANGTQADALHLQGTQINGNTVKLNTDSGGSVIESAQNSYDKDNWLAGGKLNIGASQSFDKDSNGTVNSDSEKNTHKFGVGVNVDVDKEHSVNQKNSNIEANNIAIKSKSDTVLSGASLEANKVTGNIGGNLKIESRMDSKEATHVNVDIAAGHTNEAGSSTTSKVSQIGTSKYSGKVKENIEKSLNDVANKTEGKAKIVADKVVSGLVSPEGMTGSLKADVSTASSAHVNEKSGITATQDVKLQINGKTQLTGSLIEAENGKVNLGGSRVISQDIVIHDKEIGVKGEVPLSLGGAFTEIKNGINNGNSPVKGSFKNDNGTVNSQITSKK